MSGDGSPAPGRLSCADLRWQPAAAGKPPALLARFARSGEQRASAVFQVFHRRDGAWQPLTQSQSLLVYAELAERELSIELPAGDYAPGSVLLRLADRSSDETTRAEPVDCAPR